MECRRGGEGGVRGQKKGEGRRRSKKRDTRSVVVSEEVLG